MPLWIILTKWPAPFGPGIPALASRGERQAAAAGRQGGKDRVQAFDNGWLATDHQAVPALEPPHSTAGTDIDVVQATAAELSGSPDIVLPEGVAAIDDGVPLIKKPGELLDGCLGNVTGGQHDPDSPRRLQLCDKIFQALGSCGALPRQASDCVRILVIHDSRVSGPHEAADDVTAHTAETDHSQLHSKSPATIGLSDSILLCRANKYQVLLIRTDAPSCAS
jgi:hypothetical protein